MRHQPTIERSKFSRSDFWTLTSIILSLAAFFYTLYSSNNQNKKWDQLNLGKITIGSIRFLNFREGTKKELDTVKWGYTVETFTDPDSRVLDNGKYYVQNCLIAFNPKKNVIYGTGRSITMGELMNELARLNIKDTFGLIIEKKYYLNIEIYNIGATVCHITTQSITLKDTSLPSFGYKSTSITDQPIDVEGNQYTHTIVPVYAYTNSILPDTMELKLTLGYKDINNTKHLQAFRLRYLKPNWQVLASGKFNK